MKPSQTGQTLILFLFLLVVTRVICAAFIPPIQDEAYYFYWSRFPDWGYFDHPPFVSWIASFQSVWPAQPWAARLGTILLSVLTIPVLMSFFRRSGLQRDESLASSLILATASLAGLLFGFITTPDIPLLFCWIMALHESAAALDGKPKRWLTAGFFTGLGILGKYTMTLIGPVFLAALLARRKGLRSPWPYLGGLVCLLVIAPHGLWLAKHDWVTTRFQFGRGLKSEYNVSMPLGSDLPRAETALVGGKEMRMAQYFTRPDDPLPKPKKVPPAWLKRLQRVGDFIGGQLILWGVLLVPIANALLRNKRRSPQWTSSAHKVLTVSAAIVPLAIFGILSPFQHVEANWPAMYCVAAALLLGQYCTLSPKKLAIAAALNMLLCVLLAWHTYSPLPFSKQDRLLRETRGYEPLAHHLQTLGRPIFSDTYQNVSQLKFHVPDLPTQQWPGITRTSEIVRRPAMNPQHWADVQEAKSFYLLTDNLVPPFIPGAEIMELSEILDCVDGRLEITRYDPQVPYVRACEKRNHRWSLALYRTL